MGWGWLGGHWSCLACTWHQYGPILLRMKTWKDPSTFCHSNMVQTSSNSGAPRSQFRFQVFFGGKIGLQDSGLRGFAWALGCGRTIKNFILKDFCLCWDRIQVFMSECWKFHFKTILIWEHMHFFLMVFSSESFLFGFQFSESFNFSEFPLQISNFVKVSMSESWYFHFWGGLSESFHFWELFFFHFWGGHSQSYHFWEFPLQILHFLTETFHFWRFTFLRVPFQISSFQQVSIIESQSFRFRFLKDFPFLRVSIFEVAFLRVDHFISNFQLSRTACLRVGISILLRESTSSCLSGMVCAEI